MKSIFRNVCLFIIFNFITGNSFAQQTKLNWMDFTKLQDSMKLKPKKVFIDVYTDWCGWCKVMDKNTFSHPQIAGILNKYFYLVKFNAEQTDKIVFKGKDYVFIPQGMRGYHELAAELMDNKMSYPTVVYLDENLNKIQAIPGYYKPEDIEPILKYFGSDAYKNIPWDEYQKNFKSEL